VIAKAGDLPAGTDLDLVDLNREHRCPAGDIKLLPTVAMPIAISDDWEESPFLHRNETVNYN